MSFSYKYAQASPCRAVLGYTLDGNKMSLLTTICAAAVCNPADPDKNRSNMAGGFDEVGAFLKMPPDTIMDGDLELYREMVEELGPGFPAIMPYKEFEKRAAYLWDGKRRIGDTQEVHAIVQKSLRLKDKEMAAIISLPPTKERVGFKVEDFLLNEFNKKADVELMVRLRLGDYRSRVEQEGVARLYIKLSEEQNGAPRTHVA